MQPLGQMQNAHLAGITDSLHQELFSPTSDINTQTRAFCPLKIGFPHSVQVHLQNL